jgi:hypothetical protein
MSIRSPKYLVPSPILVIFLLLFLANANAATYFVRSGSSGNGTSWANAWGDVSSISWSTLNAGDIVCVAGGTYSGGISTAKSGTSGHPITIRRATAADSTCGSGTAGWNSAYDTKVIISSISLQNDYVTIDGAVANGIFMNLPNGNSSGISVGGPTNQVVLRYIEVSGPCGSSGCAMTGDNRSINLNHWNGSSYDLQNNMLIQYVNLHGSCTVLWSAHSTNGIIEHSRFADNKDTGGNANCHENIIAEQDSTNMTFRYNEVTNWAVEGIMACPNGGCSSSWSIYGNVWHDPFPGGYPRVLEAQGNANGPYLLYNNTFVNVSFAVANTANGGSFVSGSQGRNNIYWNSAGPGLPSDDYDLSSGSLSEGHGQGSASNPFVDSTVKTVAGYHLKASTNQGISLSSPYNVDYDGNARVNWDRGAFEYGGSSAGLPPAAPAALAATVH